MPGPSAAGWARYLAWRVENRHRRGRYRVFKDERDNVWLLTTPNELVYGADTWAGVMAHIAKAEKEKA